MSCYYHFTCIFKKCPYSKKITPASKSEITLHLKRHDYVELLDRAAEFQLIKNKIERRSPDWLVEHLLDFCINEID